MGVQLRSNPLTLAGVLLLFGAGACTADVAGSLDVEGTDTLVDGNAGGSGNDDDDDDTGGDDDDSQAGDDDTGPDLQELTAVLYLEATAHQPQGRTTFGEGRFAQELSEGAFGSRPPDQLLDPARGDDFGCDVVTPDSSASRGSDYATFDAGSTLEFTPSDNATSFALELDRVIDQDIYYQSEAISGLPPLGSWLALTTSGGPDLDAMTISEALWVPSSIAVQEPSLDFGEGRLEVLPNRGMSFEWTPPGTHGIHIGIEFWDNNSQQYWSVECWVEDSGSFVVGAEHLQHMPLDLNGEVWLRHYVTKELEAGPEDIPVYSVGAYRKRWFLILLEEDDKPVDG